jgi:molybdenum cofactor guanylyltransferase
MVPAGVGCKLKSGLRALAISKLRSFVCIIDRMQVRDRAVFILAGGKSTRMGTDKAFVTLDGRTLLSRMLDLARSITPDVRIVGPKEKYAPFAPVVEDIFPGCGPLAGIHSALRSSQKDLNLILAVDVPFVSLALLQYLMTRARSLPSATVTVARSNRGWQPLCAVYRPKFANIAEKALREGQYKIDALFDQAETQVITPWDLEAVGFAERIFRNLNTPEDLVAATQ